MLSVPNVHAGFGVVGGGVCVCYAAVCVGELEMMSFIDEQRG